MDYNTIPTDYITEKMEECLTLLRDEGFMPPLTLAGQTSNCIVFAYRYTGPWEDLKVETVLNPVSSLQIPLHLAFVDTKGIA